MASLATAATQSLTLHFDGTWEDVAAWVCSELDAFLDAVRSGVASSVLLLPLEVRSIAEDWSRLRYAVRLRVVWEPPRERCARPDAWLFSAGNRTSRDERRLSFRLTRAKDAYLEAVPPRRPGPVIPAHGLG